MPRSPATTRRELGKVYTPVAIARGMVRGCLQSWEGAITVQCDARSASACRVLDPACGDGAFLLAIFDELAKRRFPAGSSAAQRLAIVRDQIFGVDIDPPAVATLRSELLARIDPPDEIAAEAAATLEQNIHCGDSLAGPDFSRPPHQQLDLRTAGKAEIPDAISWPDAFPAAARAGGFDIVVGNPPYLRERNSKALFDRLAANEIGRRWRDARMDLWYYFLHRSLDLLRPGGVLAFIVNSYWTSSRGAGRLIDRLDRETSFEEIQLLHDAPVFKSVAGRHMIFRLRKRTGTGDAPAGERNPSHGQCLIVPSLDPAANPYSLSHEDLFQNRRLVVAPPDADRHLFQACATLNDSFDTRQGIAENPPCITRRLQQEFPDHYEVGAGVFVLSPDEIARLNLLPLERELLRPYYDTHAIRRYSLPEQPTHQLLYLTRQTAPHLEQFPTILAHLEHYRPILERRREVRLGRCAWWHLHWPREEEIFLQPKVFSVQMGKRPPFVFCGRPAFVGFSVNLILPGSRPGCSLAALTGILNSNLAFRWFERHAKRRGANVEINAHLLQQFPLPGRGEQLEGRIAKVVSLRQAEPGAALASEHDAAIEDLVRELYENC